MDENTRVEAVEVSDTGDVQPEGPEGNEEVRKAESNDPTPEAAVNGVTFYRIADGDVIMGAAGRVFRFSAEEWAEVVAALSHRGLTKETIAEAQILHNG